MIRNKRKGLRLKVMFDPSYSVSFCANCCIRDVWCVDACQEYEKVTGTAKYYWFERDEDSKD